MSLNTRSSIVKSILLRHKLLILFTVFVGLVNTLSNLLVAYSLMRIIELAERYKEVNFLISTIVITALTVVLEPLSLYVFMCLRFKVSKLFRDELTEDIFNEVLVSDNDYRSSKNESFFISIFVNDITNLSEDFVPGLLEGISNFFLLIFSVTYLFYMSPLLAIVTISTSLISLFYPALSSGSLEKKRKKYVDAQEAFVDKIKDSIRFLPLIKIYSLNKKEGKEVKDSNKAQTDSSYKYKKKTAFVNALSNLFGSVSSICTFGVGIYLVIKGAITIAVVIGVVQTINYVIQGISGVSNNLTTVIGSKAVINKLNAFKLDKEKSKDRREELISSSFNIQFINVGFSYADRVIFDNLNFTIKPNEKVLVRGDSGSGKSTVLKLISGLFFSYRGSVLIDGKEVRNINNSLYMHTLLVQQEMMLFHDTIKNNITLGVEYSDDDYAKVLQITGLNKTLSNFENGDNEVITDNGKNISGGEKQRIGLARALIRKPDCLLLDEAFSALDKESETFIRDNLFKLPCTLIEVSHSALIDESRYDKTIRL